MSRQNRNSESEDEDTNTDGLGLAIAAGAVGFGLGALMYNMLKKSDQEQEQPQTQTLRLVRADQTQAPRNLVNPRVALAREVQRAQDREQQGPGFLDTMTALAPLVFSDVSPIPGLLKGLADHVMSFPSTSGSQNDGNNCAVCKKKLGERFKTLPCKHVLHEECYRILLSENPEAPSCVICKRCIY